MTDNVIEIRNLSRSFGHKTALCDVTLSVPKGTVFGLVGENGSGKTTLIKHVLGLFKAQTGRVSVFESDPVTDPVGVLGRIGYLSEDRDLPGWMRVGELLNYTQAFYPKWDASFAEELRVMFELDSNQRVKNLSRGQRARTGLLVALAHRPDLLVLDEPSSGLDPVVRRDILTAIIRTVADEGRNVLFSSHLLEEVERVADRLAMIHDGRVVICDSLENIIRKHHLLTLRFSQPQQHVPQFTGALSWSGQGTEWTALCNGDIEQFKREADAGGAEIVEEETPSLDEVFVARIEFQKQLSKQLSKQH